MNARTFFSDKPIAYHPILAKLTGSVTAALFLSQIAYWSDKGASNDGWIWKTQEEMTEETGLSRSEQETARKVLVKLNVMHEQRRGVPARMWYQIDWDILDNLIDALPQSSPRKPAIKKQETRNLDEAKPTDYSESITENKTETTSSSDDAADLAHLSGIRIPRPSEAKDDKRSTSGRRHIIFELYEKTFSQVVPPMLAQDLREIGERHTREELTDAFKRAAIAGAKNLNYVKKVLGELEEPAAQINKPPPFYARTWILNKGSPGEKLEVVFERLKKSGIIEPNAVINMKG